MSNPPPAANPKPQRKGSQIALGCGILLLLLIVIVVIAVSCDGSKSSAPPHPANAVELDTALRSTLGDSNRKDVKHVDHVTYDQGTNVLEVQWAINDNLTSSMLKDGALLDVVHMIATVKTATFPVKSLHVIGTFSLKDQYGNASEQPTVKAEYSADTLAKINSDGFDFHNALQVADTSWTSPAWDKG